MKATDIAKYALGAIALGMLYSLVILGKLDAKDFVDLLCGALGVLSGHAMGRASGAPPSP